MSMDIPKKEIDPTGVELTPGVPDECLGNGEGGNECCCDECNWFLLCFPEYDEPWGRTDLEQKLSADVAKRCEVLENS